MGNAASGDGYTFRGHGLIQGTDRGNHHANCFENNPDTMTDPQGAASSAAGFWQSDGLNERILGVLTRTQFDAVTHTVNTGDLQSPERWDTYQRGLAALGIAP